MNSRLLQAEWTQEQWDHCFASFCGITPEELIIPSVQPEHWPIALLETIYEETI